MKSGIIVLLSACMALFFGVAQADNDAAAGAAAQEQVRQRGILYRISHENNTAYLFGTIHVGTPDFFPLGPDATRALAQATQLVVELDVRDTAPFQRALQRYGLYAGDTGLGSRLSAPAMARLRQTLPRYGLPFEQVAQMKPWLVANLLLGLNLERSGYRWRHGAEFFLLAQAEQQKKEVRELESADFQMALFDAMTEHEQESYLLEILGDLDDGRATQRDAALIGAWMQGNGAAFEQVLHESIAGTSTLAEFTRRMLLGKRNPDMADKVAALLDSGATPFVAVGLLHLLGSGGVPELLRQRGYLVEKLH